VIARRPSCGAAQGTEPIDAWRTLPARTGAKSARGLSGHVSIPFYAEEAVVASPRHVRASYFGGPRITVRFG